MKGNIYINGLIGTLLGEDGKVKEKGVELIDVILQVKNQPKAEAFNVYINSPGGVVTTGFEIYDYLKGLDRPVHTIGQTMVASIATVVFMAGQERSLKPNTDFVLHLPQGGVNGSSDDIQGYAEMIKNVEKKILKFYNETAGLTEEEIRPILQKETFLTVDEAYKLGFANVKPVKIEPVAYFHNNKSKPNKMSKTDKQSVWNKIKNFMKDEGILNKVVFDAEQREIDFFELEDDDTVAVGAKARVDGESAEGEFVVPSEENPEETVTYVFAAGELTEIKEPEAEETEEETTDEVAALKEENESLKTQLAEAQNSVKDKETAISNLKEKNKSLMTVVNKIKALESEETPITDQKEKAPKPEQKNEKTSALGAAITNLTNKKKNGI